MGRRGVLRVGSSCAVVVGLVLLAQTVRADTVTSKGTVLRGKLTSVTSSGVEFEPEYGKGSLTIKWDDIEDVKSDGNFQILYDDEELDAPLQGYSDGKLLVGPSPAEAQAVDVKTITNGFTMGETADWRDELHSTFRYWKGNLDIGFNLQQATTDTTGLLIGARAVRKKDAFTLIFAGNYRYGTESKDVTSCPANAMCPPTSRVTTKQTSTIQDQLYGLVRGEYAFTDRLYGFGSGEGTYDAIQRLSIRAVPKAGVGYTFWQQILDEDHRNFLSGEVGPSWVYEKYFGGNHRDYVAIAFAAVAGYHLPFGAHFDARVDYLPAVDDFVNDYLLRSEASLGMPLIQPISAKLSVIDEYDNTPAPGSRPNSLFIAFGLSLGW